MNPVPQRSRSSRVTPKVDLHALADHEPVTPTARRMASGSGIVLADPVPGDAGPRAATADDFDEILYLGRRPDVMLAIEQGKFPSGRAHWQAHGNREDGGPTGSAGAIAGRGLAETAGVPGGNRESRARARFRALTLALQGVVLNQPDREPSGDELQRLEEFRPPVCLGREKTHLKFDNGEWFDDRLYRTLHGCVDGSVDGNGILQYYHFKTLGQARGFLPRMPIDEEWYVAVYPDAAASIAAGEYPDAFTHYLHRGAALGHSPTEDFDEEWYQKRYPDVRRGIEAGFLASAYQHYLLAGSAELRDANPPFSEKEYRERNPYIDNLVRLKQFRSGFDHYCRTGRTPAASGPYRAAPWLAAWHRRWAGTIAESSTFAEAIYLERHPDVVAAIAQGQFRNGCHHWIESGVVEDLLGSRSRVGGYSENYYLGRNPDVGDIVADGLMPSGYAHFLMYGYAEGRLACTPPPPPPEAADIHYPALARRLLDMPTQPLISVIVPTYNTRPAFLEKCIESVLRQIYPNWELCIADDGSTDPEVQSLLLRQAHANPRIRVTFLGRNRGISAASNAALALSTGAWIALLDHDDELSPDALLEVASAIVSDSDLDLIYSDEDKISESGDRHYDYVMKTDWSPELLTSTMYIGHLTVYRKSVIQRIGGFRSEYDEAQDFELALRASEIVKKVHHIEKCLYHWRASPLSAAFSIAAKPRGVGRQRAALEAALMRRGARGKVLAVSQGMWRLVYAPPSSRPLVSIVIPTAGRTRKVADRDVNFIRNCVHSLLDSRCYDNVEILVVDNDNLDPRTRLWLERIPTVRLVHYRSAAFNFCEKLNLGVQAARGDYVLLMNDDMEVITPHFVHDMVGLASQPGIGAVGARLLFADGRLQHAGIVMTSDGPSHAMIGEHASTPGPNGILTVTRNVTAVTGACLMVRRELYESVGGFDTEFGPIYNDVDFCLKIRQRGLRIVIDPAITLYHFESMSKRGDENWEWLLQRLTRRWKLFSDPYMHSGYKPESVFFEPRDPARGIEDFARALRRRVAREYPAVAGETIRFSIISASYNTPVRFLSELEESVLGQFYRNFEWIVVEDGSGDPDTLAWFERVRKHARVTAIRFDKNQGIMAGLRAGLQAASGDYVLPVDADDFLMLDALSLLATAIIGHGRPACLYTDECKSDAGSRLMRPFHKPDWDPILFSNLCYACHLACIRRDVALAVGCYEDDAATWCHDWDSYWRIHRAGHDLVHVHDVTYAWRIHPQSTASVETFNKPQGIVSQEHVLGRQLALSGWGKWLEFVPNELLPHPGTWRLKPRVGVPLKVSVVVDVGGRSAADMNACLSKILAESPDARIYVIPGSSEEEMVQLAHLVSDLPKDRFVVVTAHGDTKGALRRAIADGDGADADGADADGADGDGADVDGLVCWIDANTVPVGDGWLAETVGLLTAFDDALAASGRVVGTDDRILWAGGHFGVNGFLDSPDFGLTVADGGYHGFALCQRSVDGVPIVHWIARASFLGETLDLMPDQCDKELIATALALHAAKRRGRVIYSPFNLMKTTLRAVRPLVPDADMARALGTGIPARSRYYSDRLSGEFGLHWVPRYQIEHEAGVRD